jgi:hypothetical protein
MQRGAFGDLYDIGRFHDPPSRDIGASPVKLEEEPVDVSFIPEYGKHGSPA